MARTRTIRDEPAPPDDACVLRALTVGIELTRGELEANARANQEVYGFWGISVFLAVDATDVAALHGGRLSAFELIAHLVVGDLRAAGLALLPTGAVPHQDIVTTSDAPYGQTEADLELLLDAVMSVPHNVRENPLWDPEGGS